MRYPEFEHLTLMVDLRNRSVTCYRTDSGNLFYVEHGFYKALQTIKNLYPDRYQDAIEAMLELADRASVTIFAADDRNPQVTLDRDAVVLTPADIIEKIGLYI